MDKLEEIMDWKRRESAGRIRPVSDAELQSSRSPSASGSFIKALQAREGLAVISEVKRRSPSAGEIRDIASAAGQAKAYAQAGADCLSILTDGKYFGGDLSDLANTSRQLEDDNLPIPCLRKDFIFHPVHVLEAARAGAAAVLIIVRTLSDEEIRALRRAAELTGMDALYEIHSEPELHRALAHDAKIIGVNNRDLAVFQTDLAISEKLIPQIPTGIVPISESGIWNRADAQRARAAGAKAVLVGEALMKAPSVSGLMRDFHSA